MSLVVVRMMPPPLCPQLQVALALEVAVGVALASVPQGVLAIRSPEVASEEYLASER